MASTSNLRSRPLDPDTEYFWYNARHDELVTTQGDHLFIENNKGVIEKYYLTGVNSILKAMGCTLLGEV